jgi:integrase/recombinase XerD
MTDAQLPDELARAFMLERFDDFLSLEQGSAERTREAYGRDVQRLASFAVSKGVRAPAVLTPRHLRDFVYHLKDLGLAATSIRRNVSAIRTYFRFLVAEGLVATDPSDRLEMPTRWRDLPDVLTVDEVTRLLAAPSQDDAMRFRDCAMLELAYGAGLRVGEWITLPVKDVLLGEGLVRVFGKGSKERLVPIGRSAITAVAIYLRELRPRLERGEGKGVLFLNARGTALSRMGAWKIVRKHVELSLNALIDRAQLQLGDYQDRLGGSDNPAGMQGLIVQAEQHYDELTHRLDTTSWRMSVRGCPRPPTRWRTSPFRQGPPWPRWSGHAPQPRHQTAPRARSSSFRPRGVATARRRAST